MHRKSRRLNELRELPLRHNPDVLDYLVRRADFGVAVVPGKFQELQEIECRLGILAKQFMSSGCPCIAPIRPTDNQKVHSCTCERQVRGATVNVRISARPIALSAASRTNTNSAFYPFRGWKDAVL